MGNNSHTAFYFDGVQRGYSTQELSKVDLKYLNRGYAGSQNCGGQNAHYDEIKLIGKPLTTDEIAEHYERENKIRDHYGWN